MGTIRTAVASDEECDLPADPGEAEAVEVALRAAHSLNNVVTVILANTDVLLAPRPHAEAEVTECANDIRDAAKRAADIAEGILHALRRRP